MADCLLRDSYMLTQHDGPATAAELLGIDAAAIHNAVSDLPEGSDNRAAVIAVALVLGSLEARAGKDAWRNPAPVREPGDDRIHYGRSVTSGDYLRFLAANGTPSVPSRKSSPARALLMRSTTNIWPSPAGSDPSGGAGLRFCPTQTQTPRSSQP